MGAFFVNPNLLAGLKLNNEQGLNALVTAVAEG